ncbi:unnamed protein product [Gongylonema pulchrum]|uniref:Uncharacterized protein n=1 Tax=Gongylonema pulchrum TaxID=637853 RepID=A0A3P6QZB9_9BILA|nr:unnamed protein product [Gongylonema pulchrum]
MLRTKPQLQWEAVPDLSFDQQNQQIPVTIYPIIVQCSVVVVSFKTSFGPIGVFIPQFYFLKNALFSCCPIETTIAYARLLQRSVKTRINCWKVSLTSALIVSLSAFAMAVCCTALALHAAQYQR